MTEINGMTHDRQPADLSACADGITDINGIAVSGEADLQPTTPGVMRATAARCAVLRALGVTDVLEPKETDQTDPGMWNVPRMKAAKRLTASTREE